MGNIFGNATGNFKYCVNEWKSQFHGKINLIVSFK